MADYVSIKAALDDASHTCFYGNDFDQTPLHNNFTAIWPTYFDGDWHQRPGYETGDGRLVVYGNGYKVLYQPLLTWDAKDNHNNPLYPTFYIDGQPYSSPGISRLIGKVYTINVSDIPGYVFTHFSYDGSIYGSRPANMYISDGHELTAHYLPYHDVSTGSVYLDNGQYHQFEVPFEIDGEEVGPTWYTYQVSEGDHSFEVPYVAWAWPGGAIVFQYWVVNGFPYYGSNYIEGTVQDDLFLGAVYEVIYL